MRTDFAIAAAAACLGVLYLVGVSTIPRLAIGDPLGPRAFPILIGIGMLGAAALLVFETRKAPPSDEDRPCLPPFDLRLLAVIVALFLLAIFFEPVGYVLSVGLFLLSLTMYLNRGHLIANVATSFGFTLISAYVFNHLLGVRLPSGLLGV